MADARAEAERVARASYGRLVAWLAKRAGGDVAAAEDALADAFASALTRWPIDGAPLNPEAWILTAAKRRLTDAWRRRAVRAAGQETIALMIDDAEQADPAALPDERLALLFACAHPAIDPAARTPLMLQTVLGLDAKSIASAFLVEPAAMSQRLVRAKSKIKGARIPFRKPARDDLPERLDAVLDAVYAAFATGWEDASGADARQRDLADEAVFLARLIVSLAPEAAEARGLLALLLHCQARRAARRRPDGGYVPLEAQDISLWRAELIDEAEAELTHALAEATPGRFQIEAAIQSAHAARRDTGVTDWPAIVRLYDLLLALAPSLGAAVAQAAARIETGAAIDALAALDALPAERIAGYQPYWATRAEALARLDRVDAAEAYDQAIRLSADESVRRFLITRRDRLAARA